MDLKVGFNLSSNLEQVFILKHPKDTELMEMFRMGLLKL